MDPDLLDHTGLVSILPISFWLSLALATLGFSLSLDVTCRLSALRPLSIGLLILILHATPPIVYETLRYSWAWKHIGIVDYIQRHGHVDRTAPFLAAYHNWPLFFWLSAKLANALDLAPLQIANLVRFFPILSNFCFAGLLYAILRRFSYDFRLVWSSVWLFICANWVGQDYYSPQAFAFSLYLAVLALCLGPLARPAILPNGKVARCLYALKTQLVRGMPKATAISRQRHVLSVVAAGIAICAIVASHQLTPLILFNALLLLWLLAGVSAGYAALTFMAIIAWIIFPAAPFTRVELPEQVIGMLNAMDGLTEKFVDTSTVDPQVALVAWGGRVLTIGVGLIAALGWLRRFLHGGRDGVALALMLAPLPVLLFTSYGGEAVFRIYFFSVPFFAFFAGALFFPTNSTGRGVATRALFGVTTFGMLVGFLLGNNGKDAQYRFSPEEVAGAAWLYERATPGSLLIEGARNYPSQFLNYEDFAYVPLANESRVEQEKILADPARVLGRWLRSDRWTAGFVILTRSQKAYVDALGKMPLGGLDRIDDALLSSADFQLVYANRDVRIFTLRSQTGSD